MFTSNLTLWLRLQSQEPKCFLSRDRKAFSKLAARSELSSFNCRYIDGFENGLGFIKKVLDAAASPQQTGSEDV